MSTDTAVGAPPRAVVFPALEPTGESEGYTRGHSIGYAAGLRGAAADVAAREERREAELASALAAERARTDRAVAALDAAARSLQARTAPVLAEVDASLVAAALELAEAVIARELSDGPRGARAALARALSAPDAADVTAVRLHPDDVAVVDAEKDAGAVLLVADPGLARGDAVAVYPDGELDARIGSALARARSVLEGSLG